MMSDRRSKIWIALKQINAFVCYMLMKLLSQFVLVKPNSTTEMADSFGLMQTVTYRNNLFFNGKQSI